jgi:uncharacterized protein YdaU (DUF1376 family)
MTKDELEWAPMYMMQDARDIRGLSDEAVAAYFRLKIEYYLRGELPTDDEVKKIAEVRPQKWRAVRAELMKVFSANWQHEKRDKVLKESRQKLASYRSRAQTASAAAAAVRSGRNAPVGDAAPQEECPF